MCLKTMPRNKEHFSKLKCHFGILENKEKSWQARREWKDFVVSFGGSAEQRIMLCHCVSKGEDPEAKGPNKNKDCL